VKKKQTLPLPKRGRVKPKKRVEGKTELDAFCRSKLKIIQQCTKEKEQTNERFGVNSVIKFP
jgi:hypothetical protein